MKLIFESENFNNLIGKLVTEDINPLSYEDTQNQFLSLIDSAISNLDNAGMSVEMNSNDYIDLELIINSGYDKVLDVIMSNDQYKTLGDYLDYYSREENLANPDENLIDGVGFDYYSKNKNVLSIANNILSQYQNKDSEQEEFSKSQIDYNR